MKYYFAADVHLGLPPAAESRERERRFVEWLDRIKPEASEIFLLGDVFDFWFEYSKVVPKGFVRTLGKIAELCDAGIPVHLFAGNHDLWFRDYIPSETGAIVHPLDYETVLDGYRFYMTHGDALNTDDRNQMFLRSIFTSRTLQKLYAGIHPWLGLTFAHAWSASNRKKHKGIDFDADNRFYVHARRKAEKGKYDCLVMGHLHLPLNINENGFNFVVLPDWLSSGGGGAVFENGKFSFVV
ncbi:MAG: UDP-2,3-diacylglucosamine diphosphatase [Prevotellaceae bacterium]|nr:UDP-2,3-diacylglucosamine diphosphatase [Prevotellaceae bacterium]